MCILYVLTDIISKKQEISRSRACRCDSPHTFEQAVLVACVFDALSVLFPAILRPLLIHTCLICSQIITFILSCVKVYRRRTASLSAGTMSCLYRIKDKTSLYGIRESETPIFRYFLCLRLCESLINETNGPSCSEVYINQKVPQLQAQFSKRIISRFFTPVIQSCIS